MNIEDLNRRWLSAWSDKDAAGVAGFYATDATHRDPAVPAGLTGRAAITDYLLRLFAATPPMRYEPDAVFAIEGGFCGRWICTIDGPTRSFLRGFDLVLLRDGLIAHNEVYTHTLAVDPR